MHSFFDGYQWVSKPINSKNGGSPISCLKIFSPQTLWHLDKSSKFYIFAGYEDGNISVFIGTGNSKSKFGPVDISECTQKIPLGIMKIVHIDIDQSMQHALVTFDTGMVNLYNL